MQLFAGACVEMMWGRNWFLIDSCMNNQLEASLQTGSCRQVLDEMSREAARDQMRGEEQLSSTQQLSQPMELPSYEEATKQPLASDRMGTKFCRQVFCQKGFVSYHKEVVILILVS